MHEKMGYMVVLYLSSDNKHSSDSSSEFPLENKKVPPFCGVSTTPPTYHFSSSSLKVSTRHPHYQFLQRPTGRPLQPKHCTSDNDLHYIGILLDEQGPRDFLSQKKRLLYSYQNNITLLDEQGKGQETC